MAEVKTQTAPVVETPTNPAAVPGEESGSKMWLWVGIVAAVIVVAGLILWLL